MSLDEAGEFYPKFLSLSQQYTADDRACIEGTVIRLQGIATSAERPGMLLGKIQSGKTKTFLGIIALGFDNGFDIAIILTKGTKALTRQTLERVRREFASFQQQDQVQIFDIMTVPGGLTGWELEQKLIFVSKKQSDNLDRLWTLIRETYPSLGRKRALIIDDEADYASVGFRNSRSDGLQANVTTQQIDGLRSAFESSAFLQVTATPYALYLQPDEMIVNNIEFRPSRPAFTQLVPVPDSYVGSDHYFDRGESANPLTAHLYHSVSARELTVLKEPDRRRFKPEECLTSSAIPALRSAICNFIVGGIIRRVQDQRAGLAPDKFSFLFHTEAARASHAWQESVVLTIKEKLVEAVEAAPDVLASLFTRAYQDLAGSITLMNHDLPSQDEVVSAAFDALRADWLMITKVNSDRQVEELLDDEGQLRLRTPLNMFIGGQILDRGITVRNLIGFFYGRRPNVYQQDTVLQHSRMFGYRPIQDLAVTRFYTGVPIFDAMRRMHESDVALRDAVAANPESPVVFIQRDAAGRVIPCSPNKILISNTTTLRPFKRILPVGFQTDYATRMRPIVRNIDRMVRALADGKGFDRPFRVPLADALQIWDVIRPSLILDTDQGYTFDWAASRAALEYLSNAARSEESRGRVLLLVREDRNMSRLITSGGRETHSDAPDTAQREGAIARSEALDIPMLMLFRQNGLEEQGWRGTPFYWPVIWVPTNTQTAVFSHATA